MVIPTISRKSIPIICRNIYHIYINNHKSFNRQDLMKKKPCNTTVCVLTSTYCSFPFLERNLPYFGHTSKMTSTTEVPCPKRPAILYLKIPVATRILCMIVPLGMHWNNIKEF
ncbi:hypothetical protein LOK49_LG02G01303 [Camellia lanceoleosa]|uniref:Uncharacterized protein n=1 Tax=Camellia lanceoleosa TaxID=1840588 RepID=A0ACC0IPH2_9ERIC|nr:hypothetical protein LOK49_LG02G01303 [Camellia lanceoleosa]